MLVMFTGTVTGGLMAVAQLGVIAHDLGVKDIQVNLYFFTMAALPFALMMDRIMNGISRPMFGWISDHIGREKTMFIAFTLEGLGILALGCFGHNPWAFVMLSGVVFLAWGEVYSLFSATAGDTFGTKHIGKIYGVALLRQGHRRAARAVRQPASWRRPGRGPPCSTRWRPWTSCAAFAAIFILRPMRHRYAQADAALGLRPKSILAQG